MASHLWIQVNASIYELRIMVFDLRSSFEEENADFSFISFHSHSDKMLCSGTSAHTAFLTRSKCSVLTHTWFYGQKMNLYCPKKSTLKILIAMHFFKPECSGQAAL